MHATYLNIFSAAALNLASSSVLANWSLSACAMRYFPGTRYCLTTSSASSSAMHGTPSTGFVWQSLQTWHAAVELACGARASWLGACIGKCSASCINTIVNGPQHSTYAQHIIPFTPLPDMPAHHSISAHPPYTRTLQHSLTTIYSFTRPFSVKTYKCAQSRASVARSCPPRAGPPRCQTAASMSSRPDRSP